MFDVNLRDGRVYKKTEDGERLLTDGIYEGENENGERVILSVSEDSYAIRTIQNNGWMRINIYHIDGTIEEIFENK